MHFLLPLLLACTRPPSPALDAAPDPGPQPSWVRTADGADVHLLRYPAQGPPVLLVHGISSNHWTWDLQPDRSLARALQARGYDAWLVDLRGHGLATVDREGRRQRSGWTMDDYGRYDLPAVIDEVRARTGQAQVSYVGHSMGGMVAAIYQALHGDEALAGLVVVGSPVDFGQAEPLLELAAASSPLATLAPTLATPWMARAVSGLPRSPWIIDELLFNPDNVSEATRRLMYREIVSPLSRGELRQLNDMLKSGRFLSADGQTDYLAGLQGLQTPLLVLAGRGDRIAPVDRVAPWITHASSTDETLVVAGKADGFHYDYGHLDLAIGEAAPQEIYPRIVDWLDARRDGTADAGF